MLKTTQIKVPNGLAETSSKARFANHNKDLNHGGQYKNSTELSKYIRFLKGDQITS